MKTRSIIPLFIIGGFLLWLGTYFTILEILRLDRKEAIEITNSIISALAFAGVIITVWMQQKELSLQIQELKDTRSEFAEQNKTLKKQRFENTFFSLLDVHNSITDKIYFFRDGKEYRSRDAISFVYDQFRGTFLNAYRENGSPEITKDSIDKHRILVIESFGKVYRDYEQYLGHYFRNFLILIELVQTSGLIEDTDRKQYYSIIRSQLNSYEIALHFYNFNAGFATQQKEYFDLLELGAILNTSLLPIIKHTYIYDPPHVVNTVLATKKTNEVLGEI